MAYPKGLLGHLQKVERALEKGSKSDTLPPMTTVPRTFEEYAAEEEKYGRPKPTKTDPLASFPSDFRMKKQPPKYGTKEVRQNSHIFESNQRQQYGNLTFLSGSFARLENTTIQVLVFEGHYLSLKYCDIERLVINSDLASKGPVLGKIENCRIGSLQIGEFSPKSLDITNCRIYAFTSFASEKIPTRFTLANCSFVTKAAPRSEAKQIKEIGYSDDFTLSIQAFRNLHKWASDYGMSDLAHQTRGWELALEQTLESHGVVKTALWLWGITNAHGRSPELSLFHLAWTTLALWGALWGLGTTAPATGPAWVADLSDMTRAGVAAFSNIITPYAALSPRALVQPANAFGAIAMALHGITSLSLILLTGFSLRRRFKHL